MTIRVLAFDTATAACSAAVWIDGAVYEDAIAAPNRHAEVLLPMVERVLAEAGINRAQLDVVAFGRGPGTFTGLRIGAGVAQGIAFGCDIPTVPVSSLQALAQRYADRCVLAAIDARMEQVYWAGFRPGPPQVMRTGPERLSAPDAIVVSSAGEWFGVGSGWDRYGAVMQAAIDTQVRHLAGCAPRAREVAELGAWRYREGHAVPAELAQPHYVRDKIVK